MQERENIIYLRLDRALTTTKWKNAYKDVKVHHMVDSTSDHCALLITDAFDNSTLKLCGSKWKSAERLLKQHEMIVGIQMPKWYCYYIKAMCHGSFKVE